MAIDITKCKRVRIRKPKDCSEWPSWYPSMDRFDGAVIEVKAVIYAAVPALRNSDGWYFRDSWCEPVDDAAFTPAAPPSDGKPFASDARYVPYPPHESGPGLPPPYGLLSEQAPKPRGLYRSAYCRRCGASAEWGCMCPRGE